MRSHSPSSYAGPLVGTVAAAALLYVFRSILWPFAFACVITILIHALLRAIVRLCPWVSRPAILLIAGVCALGVLAVFSVVELHGVAELGGQLPLLLARLDGLLADASRLAGLAEPITLKPFIASLDTFAIASRFLSGLGGVASGLLLTALFVTFLLISSGLIERRVRIALRGRGRESRLALERSIRGVETYLWLQTVTGVMNAGASGFIMFVVGLNFWPVWTIALFMLSFIPFVGVAIGSIGPALFALIQFPSAWPSVVIFLGIQAVAFVVGNLILPRLQATNQNIDPSAGLLALGAWSVLWGVPGAFLAIPLTLALIYQLAGTRKLRWLAVLLSHNGRPLSDTA